MRDSIIKNVRAMLEGDGRTEAEAETCRRMAERLMARHGLTEEDLEDHPDLTDDSVRANRMGDVVASMVANSVAELTGTRVWRMRNRSSKTGRRTDGWTYCFAGYRPDVEWATWLLRHLMDTAVAASRGVGDLRHRTSFVHGFGQEANERLQTLALQMGEQVLHDDCTHALVDARYAPIDDYVSEKVGPLSAGRSGSRRVHADAAGAGRDAARSASMGRPVEGGPRRLAS